MKALLWCAACLAVASPAFAQPYPAIIDLAWGDCTQGAYVANVSNACNSNTGQVGTLFASFSPPGLLPQYEGNSSIIDIQSVSATLSPWWHLESGGCRQGSLSISGDFTSGPFSCSDFWNGQAIGGYQYVTPSPGCPQAANSARIQTEMGVPEALAGPIDNSTEWYAFKLTISRANTVGTGSCAGCIDMACIVLLQMRLTQPAPAPDVVLTAPGTRTWVTYRGGLGGLCPGDCQVTPARRSTWGSIKSLYR